MSPELCHVLVVDPYRIRSRFKGLQETLADSAADALESPGEVHLSDSPEVHQISAQNRGRSAAHWSLPI